MAPNLVKARPTATLGSLFTGGMTVIAFLVAHGNISASFAKTYGPWLVLVLLAVGFLLVWLHVVPAQKAEQLAVQLEEGRIPDADLSRIEAIVREVFHGSPVAAVPAATGPVPSPPDVPPEG